jgi:hypothetical protein
MGLAERRRIAEIKEKHLPRFQKEIEEAAGFPLPLEIDLASFPEDAAVLDCYFYYFESYGPGLVASVLRRICADSIGREAVRAKVQRVVFRNGASSADSPKEKSVKLEGGTLTVEESFYGYSDKLFDEDELTRAIEAML